MKNKMLSAFLLHYGITLTLQWCRAPAADAGKDKGEELKKRRRKEFRKMKSR